MSELRLCWLSATIQLLGLTGTQGRKQSGPPMWVSTGVRWPETPGQELPGREAGQGMPGTGDMGQTLRFGGGMTYLGSSTQTSWGKRQEVRTTKRLWSSREVSSG